MQYIVDALEECLTCNNSKCNHHTADIAMAKYNSLANKLHLKSCVCKRFRDDAFVFWEHGAASLSSFFRLFEYYGRTDKITFTMENAGNTGLLELKLRIN